LRIADMVSYIIIVKQITRLRHIAMSLKIVLFIKNIEKYVTGWDKT